MSESFGENSDVYGRDVQLMSCVRHGLRRVFSSNL